MKYIILVSACFLIAPIAFAKKDRAPSSIGPCAAKVKDFAENFAVKYLDIAPDGGNTSVEQTQSKKIVLVTLTNKDGSRIRTLNIKHGPGICSIVGVETLDSEFN